MYYNMYLPNDYHNFASEEQVRSSIKNNNSSTEYNAVRERDYSISRLNVGTHTSYSLVLR